MKMLTGSLSKVTLLAVLCVFAVSIATKAQDVVTTSTTVNSDETAYLIVQRAADFGTPDSINLFVDGIRVAVIGYNETYNGPLPTGKHVLAISTNPESLPQGEPRLVEITAEPGKTYTFTAVWPDPERAALVAN